MTHTDTTPITPSYADDVAQMIAPERLARSKGFSADLVEAGIDRNALTEGAKAPDFALPDVYGQTQRLTEILSHGPAVVTFYRGEWCPYCNLQLRAYERTLQHIQALGATLVAISPQLPDGSFTMAQKHDLTFSVLSDVDNQVARQYGLVFRIHDQTRQKYLAMGIDLERSNGNNHWELPMPGTFVIDQSGIIRKAFVNADYTQRIEPVEILAALSALSHA